MPKLEDHEKEFLVLALKGHFTKKELEKLNKEFFNPGDTYWALKRAGYFKTWQPIRDNSITHTEYPDGKTEEWLGELIEIKRIALTDKGKEEARKQSDIKNRIKELKKELKEISGIDVDELIEEIDDHRNQWRNNDGENQTNW